MVPYFIPLLHHSLMWSVLNLALTFTRSSSILGPNSAQKFSFYRWRAFQSFWMIVWHNPRFYPTWFIDVLRYGSMIVQSQYLCQSRLFSKIIKLHLHKTDNFNYTQPNLSKAEQSGSVPRRHDKNQFPSLYSQNMLFNSTWPDKKSTTSFFWISAYYMETRNVYRVEVQEALKPPNKNVKQFPASDLVPCPLLSALQLDLLLLWWWFSTFSKSWI